MIKVYEATYNSDSMEGRGRQIRTGLFKREQDAQRSVAHKTDMGGGPLGNVQEVKVYESFEDYEDHQRIEARERALSKLDADDRKALGL